MGQQRETPPATMGRERGLGVWAKPALADPIPVELLSKERKRKFGGGDWKDQQGLPTGIPQVC